MKRDKENSLLYHTMHSRPMPGCLPLFFLLALIVVGIIIWYVPVKMPERVRPRGAGEVYMKNGRLADFVLRRSSPLPLHLPFVADPEYQEDAAAASMPLRMPVKILTPPKAELFESVLDSAVLSEADLLALPGTEAPVPVVSPASAAPARERTESPAQSVPVFHPGVDNETDADGEEVEP